MPIPGQFIFIALLVIFLIIYIPITAIKNKNKNLSEIQSLFNENQANCAISCRYLDGIEQMVEGKMCYIFANNEKLKIVTQENPHITVNLELSKVKTFDIIKRDKTEPHMIGFAIVQQHTYDKFIIIRYLTNEEKTKEIYFALVNTAAQRVSNKVFDDICNIFDYVNARIPKQETTIDL
ncbi:MAG: hypothetical protein GYA50_10700 [Eubacteriaceae bacterium]|nr:hypothetical protein [Eubacteriaceae bacterium]